MSLGSLLTAEWAKWESYLSLALGLTSLTDLPLELCLAEGPKLQGLREGTSRIYPNFIIAEHLLV